MNCRQCNERLENIFVDLGFAPPSNAYLTKEDLNEPELYFPLKVFICHNCWLVQTADYAKREELFKHDYAYFSSTSTTWLSHAKNYCDFIIDKLKLSADSLVIEVASNDGYLLKNFVSANIPCIGIEPTDSTATAAENLGIPVIREFFGANLANVLVSEGRQADLIIGNNVYAHVPDINDFTLGLKRLLKKEGTITLEFPHLLELIKNCQFDTIYHEHFSYLSLTTVNNIFAKFGLKIYDVEKLETHGGSLRIYGCHSDAHYKVSERVKKLLKYEIEFGITTMGTYRDFQNRVNEIKNDLLKFLIDKKKEGKIVVGYGAAAKGNTLLNYAGIKPDLLRFVCDAAPSKQNKYLPGSHIPILPPTALQECKPDFVLILPWNIANEIMTQHRYVRDWNGKFVIAVPQLTVMD